MSSSVFAQEKTDECGVYADGKIKQFDSSICPEDRLFNLYKGIFPAIVIEDLSGFIDFDFIDLKNESLSLADSRMHDMTLSVFKSFSYVGLILACLIVSAASLRALIETARTGDFLFRGVSLWRTAVGISSFFILLIPMGSGVPLIQVIIVGFIVLAISFLNYLFGIFLYFYDSQDGSLVDLNPSVLDKKMEAEANTYVLELISGVLCTKETNRFVFEQTFGSYRSTSEKAAECIFKGFDRFSTDEKISSGSEISNQKYSIQLSKTKGYKLGQYFNSGFLMGSPNSSDGVCEEFDSFSCLRLSIDVPNISDPEISKILHASKFGDVLASVTEGMNFTNYESKASSGWENIKSAVMSEIGVTSGDILTVEQASIIKNVSGIYHQSLENYFLAGYVEFSREFSSSEANNAPEQRMIGSALHVKTYRDEAFRFILDSAIEIAEDIDRAQCLIVENPDFVAKTLSSLNSDTLTLNDVYTMKCINATLNDGSVSYSAHGIVNGEPVYSRNSSEDMQKAFSEYKNQSEEIIKKYVLLVDQIKEMKIKTEELYVGSVDGIRVETNLAKIRREGGVAAGAQLFQIIKASDDEKRFSQFLWNISERFYTNYNPQTLFAKPFFSIGDASQFYNGFETFKLVKKRFSTYLNPKEVSPEEYFESNYENDLGTEVTHGETLGFLSSIKTTVTTPFELYFSGKFDPLSFDKDCSLGDSCGNLKDNPVVSLAKLGKEMVLSSSTLLAAFSVLNMGVGSLSKKSGSVNSGVSSDSESLLSGLLRNDSFKSILESLSFILPAIMKMLFFLLLIGVVFAYAVPLIPYFKYLMATIGWIILSITILFFSVIWCAFLLQLSEDSRTKASMNSAFNYLIQLVLRPSLHFIGLVAAWMLSSVLLVLLNSLYSEFFHSVNNTAQGVITGLVSHLFLMTSYVFLVFYSLSKIFDLVEIIPNEITKRISLGTVGDTEIYSKGGGIEGAYNRYKGEYGYINSRKG